MSLDEETLGELTEYALGLLSSGEAKALEAQLVPGSELQVELDEIRASLEGVAELAEPLAPDPALRHRLMNSLAGPERFGPFLRRLAERFDLAIESMREAVMDALSTEQWHPTGVPGVSFVHFQAGPALAGIDTGFVRYEPEAVFPAHVHHGRELTFILEGTIRLSSGEELGPGEEVLVGANDRHTVFAGEFGALYVTFHEGFSLESTGPGPEQR